MSIKIKWLIAGIVLCVLAIFYFVFDPATTSFFPKCPFKMATGLECPGCGSQRAIHHLLNLEFAEAMDQNLMLVVSIPYVLLGFVLDSVKKMNTKVLNWRNRLFGLRAIWIVFTLVVGFWVLRNLV